MGELLSSKTYLNILVQTEGFIRMERENRAKGPGGGAVDLHLSWEQREGEQKGNENMLLLRRGAQGREGAEGECFLPSFGCSLSSKGICRFTAIYSGHLWVFQSSGK